MKRNPFEEMGHEVQRHYFPAYATETTNGDLVELGVLVLLNQGPLMQRSRLVDPASADTATFVPTIFLSPNFDAPTPSLAELIDVGFTRPVRRFMPMTPAPSPAVTLRFADECLTIGLSLGENRYEYSTPPLPANTFRIFSSFKTLALCVDGLRPLLTTVSMLPSACYYPICECGPGLSGEDLRKLAFKCETMPLKYVSGPGAVPLNGSEYSSFEVLDSQSAPHNLDWKPLLPITCAVCGRLNHTPTPVLPARLCAQNDVKSPVSSVVCPTCTAQFEIALDSYVASLRLRPGAEPPVLDQRLTLFCLRTAFTVALARGITVKSHPLKEVCEGLVPEGIQVFFSTASPLRAEGFQFGVSHFIEETANTGHFLTTFACPYFWCCVLHPYDSEPGPVPMPRIHPAPLDADYSAGPESLPELHQRLFDTLVHR
ncbi:hypothetical protein [Actinomyces trachealis]|uniref:hypothetical protein n=1 Tax=Actinomyces trachealis TaxID=2763540 RepID=UPI0018C4BB12|nr:hypothetical protein [Actinomyces trachealis]